MTKLFLLIASGTYLLAQQGSCGANKRTDCFKGRLEIKGICSNYTIRVLKGDIDTSLIVSSWTDEQTGKSYNGVFALGSPCTFPDGIKEGDEFFFTIDRGPANQCNVCMAYYPVPPKKLAIKVLSGPCP